MKLEIALVALIGSIALPATAGQDAVPVLSDEALTPLVNRVWVRADDTGRPGPMQIFLANGTLVTDSCWETYRLSQWRQVSANAVAWEEDGMAIEAEIVALDETELVLRLLLIGGDTPEHRYVPAEVPYVCPDMER